MLGESDARDCRAVRPPSDLLLLLHPRDADRTTMQTHVRVLKHLVRESRYVVDERTVAEAILTRARSRLIADATARLTKETGSEGILPYSPPVRELAKWDGRWVGAIAARPGRE
jgi:hypothetical protein